MRPANLLFAMLILMAGVALQSCHSSRTAEPAATEDQNRLEITGTLQKQGITTYQYGTHTITTPANELYALRSGTVNLDSFLDQQVTIVAEKIADYPVDGGPEYLMVFEVKAN